MGAGLEWSVSFPGEPPSVCLCGQEAAEAPAEPSLPAPRRGLWVVRNNYALCKPRWSCVTSVQAKEHRRVTLSI